MTPIIKLEKLSAVTSHDKASILLVHGGFKPSALIVIEGPAYTSPNEPIHISPELIHGLEDILSQLELSYVTTTEVMDSRVNKHVQDVMRIFIAKDQSVANRLKIMFDDISNHHAEAGLLLGYPDSAVQSFLTDNMLGQDEEPSSTDEVSERNMRLLGHRLSKNNWRHEVKYLEASGNYLQSVSPLIYEGATKGES